jgi:hypothetical protein
MLRKFIKVDRAQTVVCAFQFQKYLFIIYCMLRKENPFEQLDDFLKVFANNKDGNYKASIADFMLIWPVENSKHHLSVVEISMILRKLKNDGYIIYDPVLKAPKSKPSEIWTCPDYVLSFEGKVFVKQNGYTQQENDKKRERRNLNLVNFCLAIGAALAGVYALIEIIKYLVSPSCP